MKNLPDKFTRSEILVAYAEGKKAYYDTKRRGYNPYADIGHEQLAAAWWDGWDNAQAESQGKGIHAAPPSRGEDENYPPDVVSRGSV